MPLISYLSFRKIDRPIPSTYEPFRLSNLLSSIGLGFLSTTSYGGKDEHLLGQHTIHMSPISTAHLNPNRETFCLGPPGTSVLIPILLNNTDPSVVKYSLIPLGYTGHRDKSKAIGKVERRELNSRELKAIEQARIEDSQLTHHSPSITQDVDEYDEYDDDESEERTGVKAFLQRTQSIRHIRLSKPGTLRLDRVVDISEIDARIAYPAEVTVVPCPRVEFMEDNVSSLEQLVRCAGQDRELQLMIDINGVPPLGLRWYKEVDGKRDHFLVEGIEGEHHGHDHSVLEPDGNGGKQRNDAPQSLKVPLVVSLDTVGTHKYVLEEIVDGMGNIVGVAPDIHSVSHGYSASANSQTTNSKSMRSVSLLRRPSFSFKNCGPGNPTSLLIGSEAPLLVSGNEADPNDGPWEVTMKYLPPSPMDDNNSKGKRTKPWQRTTRTENKKKDLIIKANAPGEYTIVGVKGKVMI
jgi:nucleoporin POM152